MYLTECPRKDRTNTRYNGMNKLVHNYIIEIITVTSNGFFSISFSTVIIRIRHLEEEKEFIN